MPKLLHQDIKDHERGILYELVGHNTLIITFGGISQGLGIPVFEFLKTLRSFDCDQIFIRDFKQAWYHEGVDEYPSISSLANHLRSKITTHKYHKVICIGNSMGGYAAILLGTLLSVDQVISFAPQTFIDTQNRLKNLDFRWRKQLKKLHRLKGVDKSFFDLKLFLEHQSHIPTIEIYYPHDDRLDRKHAERLGQLSNIKLIANLGGHRMVKQLKESQKLSEILSHAIRVKS